MKPYIEINGRKIGTDFEPLVIAEIGINHEGSLAIAKEMVDAAYRAGVEVVKHQTHIVSDEMSSAAKLVKPGNANDSIYDIMARCSLSEIDEIELKKYVEAKGMIFISTPFSRAAANRLQNMNVAAYKIGSGECNNYPLLNHIAAFGKPIILSTGMNSIESVRKAVEVIRRHGVQLALMHTTNLYPTPSKLVRLGAMQELMREFPNLPVGLSDHTTSNHACLAAVALGASILERHFTDNMQRIGPDIICSMDEWECRNLINQSKLVYSMLGGKKEPLLEEQVTSNFAFATAVTILPVLAGEKFTKENLWVKRPGIGEVFAEDYEAILGKRAAVNLPHDWHIKRSDIA